jgi:metallophosphoesterase superfamily enzyme
MRVEFAHRRQFTTVNDSRMAAPALNPTTDFARAEVQPGLWLDSRLAVWLAADRVLVMADLHWGYAASHRAQGNLLPSWGDEEIARRLHALIAAYQPAELIWLGDIVHTAAGGPAAEAFISKSPVPITLVAGNHDRRWQPARERHLRRGRLFFHHGDREETVPAGCLEVIGHHHPAVGWDDGAGGRLKLPALVASPRRLVLPAFSPWAAGAPWSDPLADDETLWAIGRGRILPLGRAAAVHPIAV